MGSFGVPFGDSGELCWCPSDRLSSISDMYNFVLVCVLFGFVFFFVAVVATVFFFA